MQITEAIRTNDKRDVKKFLWQREKCWQLQSFTTIHDMNTCLAYNLGNTKFVEGNNCAFIIFVI